MNAPCPNKTDCDCIDSPFENLTSEGLDVSRYVRQTWIPTDPPSDRYEACRGLCVSYVSQEEADECARNLAMICASDTVFYNSERTVSASCPDNANFYVVVRSGRFSAPTQAESDAIADSWAANVNIPKYKFCCAGQPCCCGGVVYGYASGNIPPNTFEMKYPGGGATNSPFTFEVLSGNLPTGMTLEATPGNGSSFDLLGTCATGGNYTCQIKFTDALGNYLVKDVTIGVVAITTTALPDYDVGVPYSYQLAAFGGSGVFAWKILSGTLPDGLTMSVSGLISGTPTAANGTPLSFEVIDQTCESVNKSFYVPKVALKTQAQVTVATVRGFDGFTGGNKKYKTVSYNGHAQASYLNPHNPSELWMVNRYDYSGSSTINGAGNIVTKHNKILSNGATGTDILPGNYATPVTNDYAGWANMGEQTWIQDATHATVQFSAALRAINNTETADGIRPLFKQGNVPIVGTPSGDSGSSSQTNVFDQTNPLILETVVPWVAPYQNHWAVAVPDINYTITLSSEYTDAEALANAQVYTNNGNTVQNSPRTTGYTSVFIGVNFQLLCTGLLNGEKYNVSVQYFDVTAGSYTTQTAQFTASGSSYVVNGTIPTPSVGHQVMVRNPKIAYA
jgi:hypothetical protein